MAVPLFLTAVRTTVRMASAGNSKCQLVILTAVGIAVRNGLSRWFFWNHHDNFILVVVLTAVRMTIFKSFCRGSGRINRPHSIDRFWADCHCHSGSYKNHRDIFWVNDCHFTNSTYYSFTNFA